MDQCLLLQFVPVGDAVLDEYVVQCIVVMMMTATVPLIADKFGNGCGGLSEVAQICGTEFRHLVHSVAKQIDQLPVQLFVAHLVGVRPILSDHKYDLLLYAVKYVYVA